MPDLILEPFRAVSVREFALPACNPCLGSTRLRFGLPRSQQPHDGCPPTPSGPLGRSDLLGLGLGLGLGSGSGSGLGCVCVWVWVRAAPLVAVIYIEDKPMWPASAAQPADYHSLARLADRGLGQHEP